MKSMKNKTREAVASFMMIMALGQPTFAQDEVDSNSTNQWYGGLGLTSVNVTCKDACEDITFGLVGKVGYDFNEYIGVEGRVVKTFMEYEQSKVEHYGIFAKPMYPVTDKLDVYGLLGYAQTDVGDIKSYNGSGLSWGLGVNYFFENNNKEEQVLKVKEAYEKKKSHTEEEKKRFQETLNDLADNENNLGVFLEYQRLIEVSDAPDINGFHLGFLYRF